MTYRAVIDNLPLVFDGHEGLADVFKVWEFIETTHLIPRRRGEPGSWVAVGVLEPDTPCEQEPPFIVVHDLVVLQDVDAQNEGEQQLQQGKHGILIIIIIIIIYNYYYLLYL